MANPRDERHRYGQHYTPPEVARLLAGLAIRSASDKVFDPACGDGRLLKEALLIKKELGSRAGQSSGLDLFGLDRSRSAVSLASRTGARVEAADFFDVGSTKRARDLTRFQGPFDAIIGNPPYIRQEFIGSRHKHRIEEALSRDRVQFPNILWPLWSGRSDIYVYFFAHAACLLKEKGRLVFLTASSWMDVDYGRALRSFLLNNFRVVAIIESGVESFFEDASINTAITVLERNSDARARSSNVVKFVRLTEKLQSIARELNQDSRKNKFGIALQFANEIEQGDSSRGAFRVRTVTQENLLSRAYSSASAKSTSWTANSRCSRRVLTVSKIKEPPEKRAGGWGRYLRAEKVFFQILEQGRERLRPLAGLASVRFGVKTGANEFFYLRNDGRKIPRCEQELGADSGVNGIARIRRGITTGANQFFYLTREQDHLGRDSHSMITVVDAAGCPHSIEARFLSPVIFSLKEIPGVVLERVERHKLFFHCSVDRDSLAGTAALEYIEHGELSGHNKRPTCAAREPWYSVANGRKPAPLLFPSKVGERWLVALNRAGAFEDKKLYGIFPETGVQEIVLAALLNSTWARYYTEITCRQMTGAQAIADIDVAVAEQILIPDPRELSKKTQRKLSETFNELAQRPVYSIFDEVSRNDRRRLDLLTLEGLGFANESERNAVLDSLYEAATANVRARLSRALIIR